MQYVAFDRLLDTGAISVISGKTYLLVEDNTMRSLIEMNRGWKIRRRHCSGNEESVAVLDCIWKANIDKFGKLCLVMVFNVQLPSIVYAINSMHVQLSMQLATGGRRAHAPTRLAVYIAASYDQQNRTCCLAPFPHCRQTSQRVHVHAFGIFFDMTDVLRQIVQQRNARTPRKICIRTCVTV